MTVGELIENLQRRYTDDTPIAYMIWDGYDVEDHMDMIYEGDDAYPPEVTAQVLTDIAEAALERLHNEGFQGEGDDIEYRTGQCLQRYIEEELAERGIPIPAKEQP